MGIESTAHTFGVGIVDNGKVLADVRSRYIPKKGGILPREVAEYFSSVAGSSIREALASAGIGIKEVNAIGIALGPGMGPQLRIGASVARVISAKYGIPLVPVNHAVAHIEIGRYVTGLKDPVVLYVSGGNTIITTYVEGRYRVFGETLDIALGNLLDTFARDVGIGPPYIIDGNHVVDVCAESGKYIKGFPYVVKGQDVSLSGLLTAAENYARNGKELSDICYTLREVSFSSVAEVTERCIAHTNKKELLLTGGVAANKVLNKKLEVLSSERGIDYRPVPFRYAGDNGVMIALTAWFEFQSGITIRPEDAYIEQRWRLDEVEIPWYYLMGQGS